MCCCTRELSTTDPPATIPNCPTLGYSNGYSEAMSRRTYGEGSVYRRTDGMWVYAVDLGWVAGIRKRKTITAKTRAGLGPKIKALNKQLEAGMSTGSVPTVEAWMTYWLDTIAPMTARPRTVEGYRSYVQTWITPHLGAHRLDKLTAAHIRGLWSTMVADGKSHATMRQCDAILSRALIIAEDEGKIAKSPARARAATPPAGPSGSHGKLTEEEAVKVLAKVVAIEDPKARSRWLAALLFGVEQGAALGLDWRTVDLDAGTAHLEQGQTRVAGKGLTVGPLKNTARSRTLPIGAIPVMVDSLRAIPGNHKGLIWGPRDNKADWRDWQDVLASAGVPAKPLHAARATTASLLHLLGVPTAVIREILGHAPGSRVTEAHYTHGDAKAVKAALRQLGDLLTPQPAPSAIAAEPATDR